MIIRLTVNDNDYTSRLETYLKNVYYNTLCDLTDGIERYEVGKLIQRILNPNVSEEWSSEQKDIIMDRIKKSFAHYVNNDVYLVSNLKIDILESFEDKWENGEAAYWLQHSDKVIIQ